MAPDELLGETVGHDGHALLGKFPEDMRAVGEDCEVAGRDEVDAAGKDLPHPNGRSP